MTSGTQACKAWVNFNGTGTVAIRAAFNVSSITDVGVGGYIVNFTNAMADGNYAAVFGNAGQNANPIPSVAAANFTDAATTLKTTQVRINTNVITTGGWTDIAEVYATFFG